MEKLEANYFHWKDPKLTEKVWPVVEGNEQFAIFASAQDRQLGSLNRMLASFCGDKKKVPAWQVFWDAYLVGPVFACWGKAVGDSRYEWSVSRNDKEIRIAFKPTQQAYDRIFDAKKCPPRSPE